MSDIITEIDGHTTKRTVRENEYKLAIKDRGHPNELFHVRFIERPPGHRPGPHLFSLSKDDEGRLYIVRPGAAADGVIVAGDGSSRDKIKVV